MERIVSQIFGKMVVKRDLETIHWSSMASPISVTA
jgi:hypothetical protein